jgi:hypothetical protein
MNLGHRTSHDAFLCRLKTTIRQANGQRGTYLTVYHITFELARHEFQRTFYVVRDLRATNMVHGLPWLDDNQASMQFGTTRVLSLMDGTHVDTQTEERKQECRLMSRNSRRNVTPERSKVRNNMNTSGH